MKEQGRWADKIALQADLSTEAFPGQSLVELFGDKRLLIERHKGVVRYSNDEICVRLKFGSICICGCGLEIARMCREQLVIVGRIDEIKLLRGC